MTTTQTKIKMKTEELEQIVCKDCQLQKNCIALDKKIMVNIYHCPAFERLVMFYVSFGELLGKED